MNSKQLKDSIISIINQHKTLLEDAKNSFIEKINDDFDMNERTIEYFIGNRNGWKISIKPSVVGLHDKFDVTIISTKDTIVTENVIYQVSDRGFYIKCFQIYKPSIEQRANCSIPSKKEITKNDKTLELIANRDVLLNRLLTRNSTFHNQLIFDALLNHYDYNSETKIDNNIKIIEKGSDIADDIIYLYRFSDLIQFYIDSSFIAHIELKSDMTLNKMPQAILAFIKNKIRKAKELGVYMSNIPPELQQQQEKGIKLHTPGIYDVR